MLDVVGGGAAFFIGDVRGLVDGGADLALELLEADLDGAVGGERVDDVDELVGPLRQQRLQSGRIEAFDGCGELLDGERVGGVPDPASKYPA